MTSTHSPVMNLMHYSAEREGQINIDFCPTWTAQVCVAKLEGSQALAKNMMYPSIRSAWLITYVAPSLQLLAFVFWRSEKLVVNVLLTASLTTQLTNLCFTEHGT